MRRVLVVDDQAVVREMVKEVVEIWDDQAEIETAEDGVEAMHLLGLKTYDLMVCDVDMPHMNGVELLEKIRRNAYNKDLPVIMVTGKSDEFDIGKALQRGASSYLTKPFNVKDLLDTLNIVSDWDLSKPSSQ